MGTNITGIGNANAIGFKSRVTGGMYFPPELKDALVGVWSAYGKSNDSTDRNIIKNKIKDRGGDFELINFNYEGTSGYNGYPIIFGKDKTYQYVNHSPNYNQTTINVTHFNTRQALLYSYIQRNGELTSYNRDYPSYKIKVSGLEEGFGLMYQYNSKANATSVSALRIEANGIYTIPKSFASDGSLTNANVWVGFVFTGTEQEQCNVTIEVLPEYKGAVVTDGVDDMIVSQNTVEEMGITDKFTVVSMIHQITLRGATVAALTNYIRQPIGHEYVRNHVANIGKTGIYGYAVYDVNHSSAGNSHIINTILGDKNDYSIHITGNLSQGKFSVQGYINGDNNAVELSQVAWYWTFIANKLLTEDEINLIIEKYNLDRPGEIVKPDVYYDIKRQKITNENHSSFDDELTDFSGNGHNMKLYNIAWEGNSGIGNYPVIFGANKTWEYMPTYNFIYSNSGSKIHITKVLHAGNGMLFSYAKINDVLQNIKEIPSFKVKVSGLEGNSTLRYSYIKTEDAKYQTLFDLNNGVHEVPKSLVPTDAVVNNTWIGFTIMPIYEEVREFDCDITIEVIPSDENTICLDGVDDYGKVTGLPIYKDYTVAALRKWLYDDSVTSTQTGSIVSKSKFGSDGAFIFEQTLNRNPPRSSTFSFGTINSLMSNDKLFEESFTYQTKYSYNGNSIQPGTGVDSDSMWLGLIRDNDSRYSKMAIWSLLLFPYSLSEFLLERQLKKYKLGTLYPNQVEFRPIVNSNLEYKSIQYINKADGTDMVVGQYYPSDTSIQILITPTQPNKVNKITINGKEPVFINSDNGVYKYEWYFDGKSPQQIKLKLGIDETLVQFNPIINSNVEYKLALYYNVEGSWVKINPGDYITIGTRISIKIFPNNIDKLVAVNSIDLENISTISKVTGEESYYCLANVTSKSPQNIDIVIDEYIRYEDIKQPYPVIFRLFNKDTNKEYTWGDIIKVGSIINIKSLIFSLNKFYSINGYSVNNKGNYSWIQISSMDIEVIKTLSFGSNSTWKFGQGPLFIYDPSLINNIGLKNLGYLPDITGQNNNLDLYNFKYIPNSGKGQYLIDFSENWIFNNAILKDQIVTFTRSTSSGVFFANIPNSYKVDIPSFTVNVDFTNTTNNNAPAYYYWNEEGIRQFIYLTKGKNILPVNYTSKSNDSSATGSGFHDSFCDTVTIEQVAFDEKALCFDGIGNYGNIPSITNVKSILMQVKWSYLGKILYDQRKNYNSEFAILSDDTNLNGDKIYAYQARNNGNTYIQGFLNKNLYASALKDLLHNITITNDLTEIGQNPYIGCTIETTYFSKMAMYKVMGFDKVISEDEIKLLNEDWLGLGNNFIYLNPNIQIDTTLAIKDIKLFQNNEEVNKGYLFTGAQNGVEFELRVSLAEGKYGLDEITVDGETISSSSEIDGYKVFKFTLLGTNEQNITIHTYDYIMYEDIVQPFPTVFRLLDTTNNYEYTYGDKLKVGSKVKFASFSNLLPELYQPNGTGQYNGVTCVSGTVITVEKQMVFSWSASFTYLKTNAPKCIFSPSKLRMPNESYRYLGYIPDISGNGNNGVFNNFAFSKMSGVNGYLEDFTTLRDYGIKGIVRTDSKIYLDESFDYDKGFWLGYTNVPSPAYKVKISGIPETGMLTYTGGVWLNLTNGINELPARTNTAENHGFVVQSPNLDWSNLVIEQIPEYEGSICFDGVDDYITIPTLSEGGKQVLMKVNWQKQDTMLYNQNPGQDNFAIFTNDYNNNNLVVAYASRNNGNTYIDGVVNNNILATQLKGITHNIVATNNNIDATITPIIGSNKNHDNFFAQMALYDFMLFDEISTDEEIKELNNIVGIEGDYVQKPSYYWDAYGKSNLDVDKGYIKDQVSLQLNNDTTNNNSLGNFNFGYEGMSGYNGYPVIFGANKTWKNKAPEGPNSYICTINANKYNITQILLSNAWTYSYIKENGELTKYNKDVESFKIKVTGLKSEIPLRYSYLSSTDATVTSNITIKSDGTYELPKSFANDGSLIDNYGWIGFSFTRISVDIPEIITDVNITIEILPEYKNGLVYDGVDDYSENASIPLLSDYTYIFKRTLLNKKYNSASIFKGSNQQSGGGAFICDYNSVEPDLLTQGYSFGAGLYVDSLNADSIVYGTRGSVNGTKITAGNNTDTEGLTVGKWRAYKEMVFYKLFLYPRTVNMLSINMVKNMMEEDGIIDLTSKLFTDKYTGDFYEMDFNNDFLIGN